MRKAVIERDGLLHRAYRHRFRAGLWFIFCEETAVSRRVYRSGDIQDGQPTCVQCLGEEALSGRTLD